MKYPLSLIAAFVFLFFVVCILGYFEPILIVGILTVAGIVASLIRIVNFILEKE